MTARTRIPALTVWRPWTTCFLLPRPVAKRAENRSWTTDYRGPLWLHGGLRWDRSAFAVAARAVRALGACVTVGRATVCLDPDMVLSTTHADHPAGLVALAELVDVCSASADADRLRCDCGPWAFPGQHHWILGETIVALPEPVPCAGHQRLWTPPADIDATARAQLGQVRAWT